MQDTRPLRQWLKQELDRRSWSYSELARRAGISQASVSNVLNVAQTPGLDFCKGVAQALDVPVDRVLRLAGHMPPLPPAVEEEEEALRLFRALSGPMRRAALSIMRALRQTAERVAPADARGGEGPTSQDRPAALSERLARQIARDLEDMPPEDRRKVLGLMRELRATPRGPEEADRVSLGSDAA